jgi:hypothetical protein
MADRRLHFKTGVSLIGMQPEALVGIDICLSMFHNRGLSMTLTSCRDGRHSAHSHHYKGLAWDIRIWDIENEVAEVCNELREYLGDEYQVIPEPDHIHVEYDPVELPER